MAGMVLIHQESTTVTYKFRENHSARGVDAQTVGERVEAIKQSRGDTFTPRDVWEDARPKDSPLHSCFTWNNKEAGDKWRDHEARQVITSIEVIGTDEQTGDETRQIAFVSVARPYTPGPAYTSTVDALSNEEYAARVIDECRRQLRGLQKRYEHIRECSQAIQAAIDELQCVTA